MLLTGDGRRALWVALPSREGRVLLERPLAAAAGELPERALGGARCHS